MLVSVNVAFARRTCHAAEAQKLRGNRDSENLFMSLRCVREEWGRRGRGRREGKGKGKQELTGRGGGERFVRSVPHTS